MGAQMGFEIAAPDHNAARGIVGESRPVGMAARSGRAVRQRTNQATMRSIALIFFAWCKR